VPGPAASKLVTRITSPVNPPCVPVNPFGIALRPASAAPADTAHVIHPARTTLFPHFMESPTCGMVQAERARPSRGHTVSEDRKEGRAARAVCAAGMVCQEAALRALGVGTLPTRMPRAGPALSTEAPAGSRFRRPSN
jgi:hypothetical protein